LVATINVATLRRVDAGSWTLQAPSADGGACCSAITFSWPSGTPGPVLTGQRFFVAEGTPMQIQASGMPTVAYRSLSDWQIDLLGASSGVPVDGGSGLGIIVFGPVPGEVREGFNGSYAVDPAIYTVDFELVR
jgi:hypothetical protein